MNLIRKYRESVGLTQIQLAEKLEISVDSIRRYECGGSEPRWSDISAMCEIFGCTADELMEGTPLNPIHRPQTSGQEAITAI